MKVRNAQRHGEEEIELQMTPMIDIVFQLLIFFIMTFKIVSPEGDFNVTMPENAPSEGEPPEKQFPPIVIHLESGRSGVLSSISINDPATADRRKRFGDFDDLNKFLRGIVEPGSAGAEATEVELDCSANLHFEYVIDAITAISGYIEKDSSGNETVKTMIENIKSTPPPEKKKSL